MNFQKTDCFGAPPPIALVLLLVAVVLAALLLIQLVCLAGLFIDLHVRIEFTPVRIRPRATAIPARGSGFSTFSASSA